MIKRAIYKFGDMWCLLVPKYLDERGYAAFETIGSLRLYAKKNNIILTNDVQEVK